MTFPAPVPDVPVANIDKAADYYVNTLRHNLGHLHVLAFSCRRNP